MLSDGNQLSSLKQAARDSAIRANDISTEYTNNLNVINGRVVVIAVGSASLLFTFIGILLGGSRSASGLEYKYIVLAVVGFLIGSSLLLASGWFASLFRFNGAFKHNLQDRAAVCKEEIRISEAGQVVDTNGTILAPDAINEHTALLNTRSQKIQDALRKTSTAEKRSRLLYRISLLGGYITLVAAYILTLIFFIGIIEIINH